MELLKDWTEYTPLELGLPISSFLYCQKSKEDIYLCWWMILIRKTKNYFRSVKPYPLNLEEPYIKSRQKIF